MPPAISRNMLKWSTETVEESKRLEYWVDAICECFLEMDASSATHSRFEAELLSIQIQSLRVNRVRGSSQDVYRSRAAIARSRENFYYLLCKEDTACNVIQEGAHSDRLLPGDLSLIDSRYCYELHFPENVDTFSIQLPTHWLETWIPEPRLHLGRRIDGYKGWGLALSAFVRQLGTPIYAIPPTVVADQLGSLLALTLDQERSEITTSSGLISRINECLSDRCTEPELCAQSIADMLNVSVRTVHRALHASQHTFGDLLMLHRVTRARRMLQSSAFDRITTAEIGRRVGLLDSSHFIKVFRRVTGCTPQQQRTMR